MRIVRVVLFSFLLSAAVLAQSADTGSAHKAAATALLNSNNTGAAHLACPASIFPLPTSNPPGGGPPRAAGAPGVAVESGPPRRGRPGMPKEDRFLTTSIC